MKRKSFAKLFTAAALSLSLLGGCIGNDNHESRGSIGDKEVEEEPTKAPTPAPEEEVTPTQAPTPTPEEEPEAEKPDYRLLQLYSYQGANFVRDPDLDEPCASGYATHIELMDDDMPQLKKAIEDYSTEKEKLLTDEGINDLAQIYWDNKDSGFVLPVYEKYRTDVVRADTVVTSLLTYYEDFMGGAHGVYSFNPVNFDSLTGKELHLEDVMDADMIADLPDILETKLLASYDSELFFNADTLSETIEESIYMNGDLNFSIGYEGLTFYFQIYELAPYVAGHQEVFLRYDEYPGLVKDEYKECSFNYCINTSVCSYLPHSADEETLYAYLMDKDDYGMYNSLNIEYKGISYKETLTAYEADFWVASIGGVNYLLVDLTHEDDYETLNIYLIDEDNHRIERKSEFFGGFYGYIPADPLSFCIFEVGDVMSTYLVYKDYYIARDGEAVSTDDDYLISFWGRDGSLTLKKDITAQVRDDYDSASYEETLKKGEKLYFYSTDKKQWVDFKLDDGRFVHLSLDKTEWPQTIDGEDIEDIFDGVMFAG